MEPRNRAKGTAKEDAKDGFRGKHPAEEPLLEQRRALVRAMRQEDSIFREHLGKVLFIEIKGDTLLAKLEKVGIDFVKLTDVRRIPSCHYFESGDKYKEFLRQMKLPGDSNEVTLPLFSGAFPSLVLNKTEIKRMVPASDYEEA